MTKAEIKELARINERISEQSQKISQIYFRPQSNKASDVKRTQADYDALDRVLRASAELQDAISDITISYVLDKVFDI